MSVETWVQLGVGILLTIIAPLLGELFWKSLFMTLAGFCFGVALWQVVESHGWHRWYFVAGCALLAVMLSSFILWSAPKQVTIETVGSKTEPQSTSSAYPAKPPEQATPTPEQTPVKVPQQHERIFVGEDITAEYLMNLFREPGHTTAQGRALVDPFIGKWMKVSGVMRDVANSDLFAQMVFERNPSIDITNWLYRADFYMHFRGSWIPRVLILRRGDKLTVIGQIRRVTSFDLQLDNCELVDSKP